MAKKQKRQVSKLTEAQRSTGMQTPGVPAAVNRPALSSEFNPDYSYVMQDLKKIGILAGSFITILVVLSFFLN
jgi:hypothetical protein